MHDKLYTVEDVARITKLTTRTIRNYLKEGQLIGRKVGGQWRFTEEDINKLFNKSDELRELSENRHQDVLDFIDGFDTDITGDIQTCSIVDYYCDRETGIYISKKIDDALNSDGAESKHSFEYIDVQKKARYTIISSPHYMKAVLDILCCESDKLQMSQKAFLNKADNYNRFRPSYPDKAVELIISLSDKAKPVIADIGSGTGKLSRLLLNKGSEVYAVEPNIDMRKTAEGELSKNKEFYSIASTAENTGLKSDSVDIITVAEAYHWFDNETARLEFKRILRPGGYVILLWNEFEVDAYVEEKDKFIEKYRKHPKQEKHISRDERADNLFGKDGYIKVSYDNSIKQNYESLLGGMLSTSYTFNQNDDNYVEFEKGLKSLFDKYSINGLLESKIHTVCYYGRI